MLFYYLYVSGDWKNEKFKRSFLKCNLVADGLTGAPEKGKPDKPVLVSPKFLVCSSNSFAFLSSKFASRSIFN